MDGWSSLLQGAYVVLQIGLVVKGNLSTTANGQFRWSANKICFRARPIVKSESASPVECAMARIFDSPIDCTGAEMRRIAIATTSGQNDHFLPIIYYTESSAIKLIIMIMASCVNVRVVKVPAYSLRFPASGKQPYRAYTRWRRLGVCRIRALHNAAQAHDYYRHVKTIEITFAIGADGSLSL